jgi:type IV pilus assembly protein PilV
MKHSLRADWREAAGGFSLIEVLVALLVLSIGLLGLAGLQARSLKENHQAFLRTQATLDAYQIIDCMRANPNNIASYNIALGAAAPTGTSIAAQDLDLWKTTLDGSQSSTVLQGGQGLPKGDGWVVVAGNQVTVVVQWEEGGKTQQIQVQTEL